MNFPLDIDLTGIPPEKIEETIYNALRAQLSTLDAVDVMLKETRAKLAAAENTPEAFGHFYYVIYGRECPAFAMKEWIPALFKARESGVGLMLEAWRGSTKSTIMQAFCWFQLGHKPEGSGMIVAASDDAATKMGALFAVVVEQLDGWKMVFPHVVPDKDRGWGASGYFIKDTRLEYNQFIQASINDHMRDPSFVGAGISSSDIVGKHPSVFLLLDDIHDSSNTRSKKEREAVIESLRANLLPTMSRAGEKPYIAVAFTPWTMDDAYSFLKASGLLASVKTPVYRDVDNVRVYSWPEAFGEEAVEKWRTALGGIEFARMYLCDISNNENIAIRYYGYSPELIKYDWIMIGGVDPINTAPGETGEPTSNFALAYVAKIPNGGAVIVDGVLKKCTDIQAENEILRAQSLYPNWQYSAVENVGGGALFIQIMRRNPNLRVIPSDLRAFNPETKGRIRSKKDRFLHEAAPWFENGTVRISEADTPFLNALRRLFSQFHLLDPKNSPEFDAGDSVYHALKAMPDVLHIGVIGDELPRPGLQKKKTNQDMFMLGRL